jgi:hypothetical protein
LIPELTAEDVRLLIERARPAPKRASRPKRVAIFGHCEGGSSTLSTADGIYEVVSVRSPLEFRKALLADRRDPGEDARAFLLGWEGAQRDLPYDLRWQFATKRVVTQVPIDRLQRLLRVQILQEVENHEIANQLTKLPDSAFRPYTHARALTLEAAFRVFFEARLGLPALDKTDTALFLLWAVAAEDCAEFAREAKSWRVSFRDEVERFLRREFDPDLFPQAFEACLEDHGAELLRVGLAIDALLAPTEDEGGELREHLLGVLSKQVGITAQKRLRALGRAASDAARDLLKSGWRSEAVRSFRPGHLAGVDIHEELRAADELLGEVRDELRVGSDLLPGALAARLRALANSVGELLATDKPDIDALLEVLVARDAVQAHALGSDSQSEASEHLARLATYVYSRRSGVLDPVGPTRLPQLQRANGDAPSAAHAASNMVRHGGWVDRALRELQGLHVPELLPVVERIAKTLQSERNQLNATFAKALATQAKSGDLSHPHWERIQDVGTRWIAPYLAGGPDRSLLVVLLDGLSWGVATELLDSLAERQWGVDAETPGWLGDPEKDGLFPKPVLAALPTVTAISRSAFFEGALPARAKALPGSGRDPARWGSHPDLKEYRPRLFLKADVGKESDLASDVRDVIADPKKWPLVGVVINAVDDWLSGAEQLTHKFSYTRIQPLAALLNACESSGRALLIASDHGHTLDQGPPAKKPASDHGRWRLGKPDSELGEVAFTGKDVWIPEGHDSIVLPARSGAAYKTHKRGYHGGATLEELVCPTLFLLPNRDPLDPPRWWSCDTSALPTEPRKPRKKTQKRKPQDTNMALFPGADEEASVVAEPFSVKLKASALWKELEPLVHSRVDRGGLYRLLDVLVRKSPLTATEVAQLTGVATRQIAGYVSNVGRGLNLDGEEVIRFDRSLKQVSLDVELLRQLFEVEA